MFERLNRGGIALSPQEVRACIYRGDYAEFLREMAKNERFDSLLKLQKRKQSDGTKEELVLKFFAYLRDRNNFKGQVKEFLNQYICSFAVFPGVQAARFPQFFRVFTISRS
jgi:hypothetical protein